VKKRITINQFEGNCSVIEELKALIDTKYAELFIGAIVHGSVATGEIINYSDFDGLLIVNDKYISSKELLQFKKESMKIIYKFDPLQHHGWFQINEGQLQQYPQTYFPFELFEYAKLIHPSQPLNLTLQIPSDLDYKQPFFDLCQAIEHNINRGYRPKNVYQLKSLLSQIMLLPALYIQAKEKHGIFKKFSFEIVEKTFGKKLLIPILMASEIRKNWSYELNFFQRWIMNKDGRIFRKITQKLLAPRISKKTSDLLDSKFFEQLQELMDSMKNNLK
jgi:hypothetical protein